MHPRVWLTAVLYATVLVECSFGAESSERDVIQPVEPVGLKLRSGRRGGRFLGLLGLLTGLTLVDTLDDDSDRPRRSGFVKIDVGHPSTLDAFYGAYGYSAPYWTGGSSINIKIPFRPAGSEFETMALFPYHPVHFPQNGPPHFGASAAAQAGIEPRPTIFSDPIPVAGPATTAADEVEQPSSRKQKLATTRRTLPPRYPASRPLKVSPPRTIRSTVRAGQEDPELVEEPDTTEQILPEEQAGEQTTTNDVGAPTNAPTDHEPSVSEDPEPATAAPTVQPELNYVTRPVIASSYHTHQHSLADVSAIELTTAADDPFQPSRADHWQDYYGSVALDASDRQLGFLPIAPPAATANWPGARDAQ